MMKESKKVKKRAKRVNFSIYDVIEFLLLACPPHKFLKPIHVQRLYHKQLDI